jgi:hypothetical protein
MASTRPDGSGKHRADVAGPAVDRHDRRRRREDRMKPREPVPCIRAGHRIFFHEQGEPLFGPGTFEQLVLVHETGSLHQAAILICM